MGRRFDRPVEIDGDLPLGQHLLGMLDVEHGGWAGKRSR